MDNQESLSYEQSGYSRYWNYHAQVQDWCKAHRSAYLRAKLKATEYENAILKEFINSRLKSFSSLSNDRNRFKRHRRRYKNNKHTATKSLSSEPSCSNEDESIEMEITEDILEFLRISQQHRQDLKTERDAAMKTESEQTDPEETPREHPGEGRRREMNLLYGKNAPLIHGMESALQLQFNRNSDYNEPKLWPHLPLNL